LSPEARKNPDQSLDFMMFLVMVGLASLGEPHPTILFLMNWCDLPYPASITEIRKRNQWSISIMNHSLKRILILSVIYGQLSLVPAFCGVLLSFTAQPGGISRILVGLMKAV
jgi:hypothetical protein